jgi:hypothetical protein
MPTLFKDLLLGVFLVCVTLAFTTLVKAATVVPTEIQMPGTQPNEVGNFESPDKCDNCHAGYNDLDPGAEPATGWRGAAMGNAGRDPVFWATLAVVEQDFIPGQGGAGDLCIRCHSAGGWYGGRSTPTDGSGLANSDDNGVDCDTCHASTNTDNTGTNPSTGGLLSGVMNSPFIANCDSDPNVPDKCSSGEGFYGSGMLSLWPQVNEKLGPFSDAQARHQWQQSAWHRDPDFCGTCHDVSNPAVGDLAPGNGAQTGYPHHVVSSQDYTGTGLPNLGGPVEEKAAFNNPPYAYGIVERTFSEYKSSPLHNMRVGEFPTLPDDLRVAGGSLDVTYQASLAADPIDPADPNNIPGDYADGTPRTFSCQSCHMRPVGTDTGGPFPGCNKNGVPLRADLPRHDHTGGNYWFASMAQYQDDAGTLRLGGGLNSTQLLAMDLGAERATKHLREAGSLSVTGNTVTVTNLTGHKLITGYPEGRRMWLNIKWYDDQGGLIREDGKYGTLQTNLDLDTDGQPDTVETILDLDGANTEIYEAHYAMTKEWADTLLAVGYPSDFALAYDRVTGAVTDTLGSLADQEPGSYVNTFHFALNNYISSDNRIPPYRMSHGEAQKRNALPVPENRYALTGTNGDAYYEHQDDVLLSPPANAVYASIDLLYQGTSWEYILFLQMANNGTNAFLGGEGNAMMDAWLNAEVVKSTGAPITGVVSVPDNAQGEGKYNMVPPVIMASTAWGTPPVCSPTPGQETTETSCQDGTDNDCDGATDAADTDCAPVCVPTGPSETVCDDGLDDDCDGLFDCDDSDCDGDPACQTGMACGDYVDKGACNNDPNCEWVGSPKSGFCQDAVACSPTENPEVSCTDGLDNDCNGATDCDDGNCSADPACQVACNNDGVCDQGEDCEGCPNDCAGVTGGKPANRFCCGNGVQEGAEGDGSICDGNY